MKKLLALVIGVIFGLSGFLTAFASFDDVDENTPNADAINFLSDAGVVNGHKDGNFKPKFAINRAELMKILVEAEGITPDAETYNNCFPDVKEEWFAPYVCYAKELGWVNGYDDGTFKPEKPVNKVESVKMIVNSQGFGGEAEACKEKVYSDADENEWYGKFVCVAHKRGLLEEDEKEKYLPGTDVKRFQVSENIYRAIMVKKLVKEEYKEEYKEMKGEALETFKAEKDLLKAEIDAFKEEIKLMKEAGEDSEYIQAEREEFWGSLKEAHKNNVEDLVGDLKEAHEDMKEKREHAKAVFKECKDGLKEDPEFECGELFEDDEDDEEDDMEDTDDDTDDDDMDYTDDDSHEDDDMDDTDDEEDEDDDSDEDDDDDEMDDTDADDDDPTTV